MSYPKPLVFLRYRHVARPLTLDPANCDPIQMGIQISSLPLFSLSGTPVIDFALIGKGSHHAPSQPPQVSSVDTPDPDIPWTIQGAEISIYLDSRADKTATFNSDGSTPDVKLVFVGDIHEIRPAENNQNPWHAYLCTAHSLIVRAERVSVVSPINSSDVARFNINALSAEYEPATGGKSIGEAIQMILEEYGAAYWLDKYGIGKYTIDTQLQTAAIHATTVNDLRQLTLVPPFEFRISGDNIIAGIQQFLDAFAPNYVMTIQPDGLFRFLDIRNLAVDNVDFGSDLADKLDYSKSTISSYSKVIVRGGPKIAPVYVQWSIPRGMSPNPDNSGDKDLFSGSLVEQFDYSGANNDQAKTNYTHDEYKYGRPWISKGSVSFTSTLGDPLPSNQVRLTPQSGYLYGTVPSLTSWGEDHLLPQDDSKQTRRDCRLTIQRTIKKLETETEPEILVEVKRGSFLVTRNTAVVSGNSIVTTAPNVWRTPERYLTAAYQVSYIYELYGNTPAGSSVWRVYKVQLDPPDPDAPEGYKRKLATLFSEPVPTLKLSNLSSSSGVVDGRTWSPLLLAEYRQDVNLTSGKTYSYTHNWIGFRIDAANNLIVLEHPAAKFNSPNGFYDNQIDPPWGDLVNEQPFKFVPYNIKAVLPVFEGRYEAVYPPEPTAFNPTPPVALIKSAYGIDRELAVSLEEWQDGRDQLYAEDYAKEIWDSVKQPMISGGFVWLGESMPTWNAYSIGEQPDPNSPGDTRPTVQGFRLKAVIQGGCSDGTEGTGIEDVALLMTGCVIRFGVGTRPTLGVTFATSKPRLGPAMHDFHSFQERLTEFEYT